MHTGENYVCTWLNKFEVQILYHNVFLRCLGARTSVSHEVTKLALPNMEDLGQEPILLSDVLLSTLSQVEEG